MAGYGGDEGVHERTVCGARGQPGQPAATPVVPLEPRRVPGGSPGDPPVGVQRAPDRARDHKSVIDFVTTVEPPNMATVPALNHSGELAARHVS